MWKWLVGCEVLIRSTYVHPQCFFLLNRCAVLSTIVCLFCYFFFWSLYYLSFDLWIPIIAINTIHHLQTHYTILAIRSHHTPYMYSILLLEYYSPAFPLVILVILTIPVNYHWFPLVVLFWVLLSNITGSHWFYWSENQCRLSLGPTDCIV